MREVLLILGAALLGMVALLGDMNGGHIEYTMLFLGFTYIFLFLAQKGISSHRFIIAVGLPLILMVRPEPIFTFPIAILLLGLSLFAGSAPHTRIDFGLYAGSVMLALPAILLFPLVQDTFLLVLLLLTITLISGVLLGLLSLQLRIQMREDIG